MRRLSAAHYLISSPRLIETSSRRSADAFVRQEHTAAGAQKSNHVSCFQAALERMGHFKIDFRYYASQECIPPRLRALDFSDHGNLGRSDEIFQAAGVGQGTLPRRRLEGIARRCVFRLPREAPVEMVLRIDIYGQNHSGGN